MEGWVSVTLPDVWGTRWPSHDGAVWYQVRWQSACPDSGVHAVAVSHLTMAGSVFINDTLLWRDARLEEPFSRSWNMPRYWVLPEAALQDERENTLWFRVTGMPHDVLGLGTVDIGPPSTIWSIHARQVWQKRNLFKFNLSVSLVLGCLFLMLWSVQRSEKAYGWYAMASLCWALFAYTMLATSPWPFANSADWNRAAMLVLAFYCSAFCLFVWRFSGQQNPRLTRLLWGITLLLATVIWWVPDERLTQLLMIVVTGYALVFMLNCAQFQLYAWRDRRRHNVLLAMCLLFFLAVVLHDVLLVSGLIGGEHVFSPVTSPIAMIFMFLIVADRFAGNLRRIKAFSSELQNAVDTSREELTRTLEHQHRLETRNVRLTERLKLSHDLHDSLGSSLMRSITIVEHSGAPLENTRFLSMLKELRDDLRQIIDNTGTTVVTHATPSAWLAPLRHRFVRLFEELGLTSSWQVPRDWPWLPSSVSLLALTRFVEEALTNAIKHSRGDHFEVRLQADDNGDLHLHVCDNGIGFDCAVADSGSGVGLRSMRARIDRIGGHLTIRSKPGKTWLGVQLGKNPSVENSGSNQLLYP